MKIQKAVKVRLYPTKAQAKNFEVNFGCARFVYNHFLQRKNEHYKETGKSLSFAKCCLELTLLKRKEEFYWLYEANNQSLQQSIKHLEFAFDKFFRKLSEFPRFKSKKNSRQSFKVVQNFIVREKKIRLPKIEEVKYRGKITGLVKANSITVSRDSNGKYYASIQGEFEIQRKPQADKIIGIDLGIKDFAVTSDGEIFENKRHLIKREKKLKFLSRKHSKAKGNARNKKRKLLAKQHFKVKMARNDYLHKVSSKIISDNQTVILEDLSVKNMVKNHKLAKHISDVSWGTFVQYLEYKAVWHNRQIVKIDRFYPSSKSCSTCHHIKSDLKLSQRTYHCDNCGLIIDRDYNASLNIKQQGLNILSGCGTQSDIKQKPVEPLPLGKVLTQDNKEIC